MNMTSTHMVTLTKEAAEKFFKEMGLERRKESLLSDTRIVRKVEKEIWDELEMFTKKLYCRYSISGDAMKWWIPREEVLEELRTSILTGCMTKGLENALNTGRICYDFQRCLSEQLTVQNALNFVDEIVQGYKECFVKEAAFIIEARESHNDEPDDRSVEIRYQKMLIQMSMKKNLG